MEFDNLKDELLSSTDSGLKHVASLNKSVDFEIFVYYENKTLASIDQGIVTAKDGAVAGTAVRASKGKQIGFAVASGVTVDRIKLAASEALTIINSVKVEDERFEGFSDPKGTGKEGAFSDDFLTIETKDLIKYCRQQIDEAREVDPRVKVVASEAEVSWKGYAVGNTRGVLSATQSGHSRCETEVFAIENEERRGLVSPPAGAQYIRLTLATTGLRPRLEMCRLLKQSHLRRGNLEEGDHRRSPLHK